MSVGTKIESLLSVLQSRAGIALIGIATLILSGCGQSGSGSSPFVPHEFDFDNRQFSIQLPPKASILSSEDKSLVMINLQAGTALSPRITMRRLFAGDASMTRGKSLKLANSAILDYKVSATNVGAGHPEAFLNGHLTLGGQRYVVSCNIQSKFVTKTHASWCLDYLGSMSVN